LRIIKGIEGMTIVEIKGQQGTIGLRGPSSGSLGIVGRGVEISRFSRRDV
jgi:hypothetical protein